VRNVSEKVKNCRYKKREENQTEQRGRPRDDHPPHNRVGATSRIFGAAGDSEPVDSDDDGGGGIMGVPHGHNANAMVVKVVSTLFENVRTRQYEVNQLVSWTRKVHLATRGPNRRRACVSSSPSVNVAQLQLMRLL
jgi:hypothetical protein